MHQHPLMVPNSDEENRYSWRSASGVSGKMYTPRNTPLPQVMEEEGPGQSEEAKKKEIKKVE
jgi:hypothetical protein